MAAHTLVYLSWTHLYSGDISGDRIRQLPSILVATSEHKVRVCSNALIQNVVGFQEIYAYQQHYLSVIIKRWNNIF